MRRNEKAIRRPFGSVRKGLLVPADPTLTLICFCWKKLDETENQDRNEGFVRGKLLTWHRTIF